MAPINDRRNPMRLWMDQLLDAAAETSRSIQMRVDQLLNEWGTGSEGQSEDPEVEPS
jgi:hypothetical protein